MCCCSRTCGLLAESVRHATKKFHRTLQGNCSTYGMVSLSRRGLNAGISPPRARHFLVTTRKYPKKRSRHSRPNGYPALLAPVGLCRQAVPGLTAKCRASCAPPCGLFLLPLRYSAGIHGHVPSLDCIGAGPSRWTTPSIADISGSSEGCLSEAAVCLASFPNA